MLEFTATKFGNNLSPSSFEAIAQEQLCAHFNKNPEASKFNLQLGTEQILIPNQQKSNQDPRQEQ